ncbi:hypothetical protein EYF80_002843 [Liparis tanakae]|uniref:Uncharacterized protein n=1 Tax=Liparis tanakae TaxID=230148 RepID=A0A4Z2JBS3_9TELE|nr:hypothetical protein EYF80_002843 [Liparis tanakae]
MEEPRRKILLHSQHPPRVSLRRLHVVGALVALNEAVELTIHDGAMRQVSQFGNRRLDEKQPLPRFQPDGLDFVTESTSSSGSNCRHVTHFHIRPQLLQLIQPYLLFLGKPARHERLHIEYSTMLLPTVTHVDKKTQNRDEKRSQLTSEHVLPSWDVQTSSSMACSVSTDDSLSNCTRQSIASFLFS